MFGRRRHAAAVPAAPAPQLNEAQIFELVRRQLATFVGSDGEWTVTPRTTAHTDAIFHEALVAAVAGDIVTALREARVRLEAEAAQSATAPAVAPVVVEEPGQHTASVESTDASAGELEPAAFGWEPAPITVWTDLRKPVTGEIPRVESPALVA